MSKESFSRKISEIMDERMNALIYYNPSVLFKNDEYFELALCMSYMTLSKEKIIKKDIKNSKRLERLDRQVEEKEINQVFDTSFSKEMPNIIYSKEKDNTWILDNIRDSIMHGAFDIDEDKKCLIIDNTQYDRELKAEIPFSWFIAYAKHDILSKKISDKCTVRGFYYNKNKKGKTYLKTEKELINNILYNVTIQNKKINIREVEKRIKELFEKCSYEEIDNSEIKKYEHEIEQEKIKYNKKYLVSFYKAKKVVKETIEKEFPGTTVNIKIDNNKNKLTNKASKKLQRIYKNYDLLYEELNSLISHKSSSLLYYITRIIEHIDLYKSIDYTKIDSLEQINLLNQILNDEKITYKKSNEIYTKFNNNLNVLKSIYINVFGLSTLVINHENLYDKYFLTQNPYEYGLFAIQKQPYLEYANKEKKLIMQILEKEIKLFEKEEQLKKCTNEKGKIYINSAIQLIETEIDTLQNELNKTIDFIEFTIFDRNVLKKENKKMQKILGIYYNHFNSARTTEGKKKVRKVIGQLLDKKIEETSKHAFSKCTAMKEVLTIIRNSFSHVGRITIGTNYGKDTILTLNDYDNNGKKSGTVMVKYNDLINLINTPLNKEEQKKFVKTDNIDII